MNLLSLPRFDSKSDSKTEAKKVLEALRLFSVCIDLERMFSFQCCSYWLFQARDDWMSLKGWISSRRQKWFFSRRCFWRCHVNDEASIRLKDDCGKTQKWVGLAPTSACDGWKQHWFHFMAPKSCWSVEGEIYGSVRARRISEEKYSSING